MTHSMSSYSFRAKCLVFDNGQRTTDNAHGAFSLHLGVRSEYIKTIVQASSLSRPDTPCQTSKFQPDPKPDISFFDRRVDHSSDLLSMNRFDREFDLRKISQDDIGGTSAL